MMAVVMRGAPGWESEESMSVVSRRLRRALKNRSRWVEKQEHPSGGGFSTQAQVGWKERC